MTISEYELHGVTSTGTKTMIAIGIDPGAKGGLAWVHEGQAVAMAFHRFTWREVWLELQSLTYNGNRCHAVLERVHAMPAQGVSSTFKFGHAAGMVEGFLVAAGVPYDTVGAAKWQRKMSCLTKGDKNVTKEAASKLFPQLKITHAVADALLLAEFCRREFCR